MRSLNGKTHQYTYVPIGAEPISTKPKRVFKEYTPPPSEYRYFKPQNKTAVKDPNFLNYLLTDSGNYYFADESVSANRLPQQYAQFQQNNPAYQNTPLGNTSTLATAAPAEGGTKSLEQDYRDSGFADRYKVGVAEGRITPKTFAAFSRRDIVTELGYDPTIQNPEFLKFLKTQSEQFYTSYGKQRINAKSVTEAVSTWNKTHPNQPITFNNNDYKVLARQVRDYGTNTRLDTMGSGANESGLSIDDINAMLASNGHPLDFAEAETGKKGAYWTQDTDSMFKE